MSSRWDAQLEARLAQQLEGVTPGVCVQAFRKGRKVLDVRVGQTYRYYDLASLTKILFTVSALMLQEAKAPGLFRTPVKDYLKWFPAENLSVAQLLTHTAGFTWWEPFYKKTAPVKGLLPKREKLRRLLTREVPHFEGTAVYSDLDFFYLGYVVEELFQRPLWECFDQVSERLGYEDLFFHPNNRPKYLRSSYAPTEKCPWRKKVLRGEVHDENAWALGGVSSHAGLFGTVEGVSRWALLLRKALRVNTVRPGWSPQVVRRYTRRALPKKQGDWALGFMTPTAGKASCGKYFSAQSFGHTGFTGTSVWLDPRRDLIVTILSNRVHPTRTNAQFVQMRPQIHNWIVELIENGRIST